MLKYLFFATIFCVAVFLVPSLSGAAAPNSGFFTFVAPTADQQLEVGKTYDIKWTSNVKWIKVPGQVISAERVRVDLYKAGVLQKTIDASTGNSQGISHLSVCC